MNIFVLDTDPILAAKYVCDKHVIKMILESAQLLCGALENAPYKKTHINHPCSKWVRESRSNFLWLVAHATQMNLEYKLRYGRAVDHKSMQVIDHCASRANEIKDGPLTPFVLAMPEQYKTSDPTLSYRLYYKNEKRRFAEWRNGEPSWWKNEENKT